MIVGLSFSFACHVIFRFKLLSCQLTVFSFSFSNGGMHACISMIFTIVVSSLYSHLLLAYHIACFQCYLLLYFKFILHMAICGRHIISTSLGFSVYNKLMHKTLLNKLIIVLPKYVKCQILKLKIVCFLNKLLSSILSIYIKAKWILPYVLVIQIIFKYLNSYLICIKIFFKKIIKKISTNYSIATILL